MVTDPIVTPEQLAAYQGGDAQTLLDQATALVRSWCGWHVTPSRTETVTLNGNGSPTLGLPSLYVTALTSVTDTDGTLLTLDTDYQWSTAGVLSRLGLGWVWGSGIAVTFTHGYDEVPELAAVIMAVASRAQKSPDGVTRVQEGLVVEQYSQTTSGAGGGVSLLPHEKDILRRYRVPVV